MFRKLYSIASKAFFFLLNYAILLLPNIMYLTTYVFTCTVIVLLSENAHLVSSTCIKKTLNVTKIFYADTLSFNHNNKEFIHRLAMDNEMNEINFNDTIDSAPTESVSITNIDSINIESNKNEII